MRVKAIAARTEVDLSTFIDTPPSMAQGGSGVVVTGCPMCRKQFGAVAQFVQHVTDDVLPALLAAEFEKILDHSESRKRPPGFLRTVEGRRP
jgi:hypothetical protein